MIRWAGVLVIGAVLAGCGETAGGPLIGGTPDSTGSDTTSPRLRFLHAATATSNLQLLINGQSRLGQIGFGSITPYVDLSGASVELTVVGDNSITPVFDSVFSTGLDSLTTVIADGDSGGILVRLLPDSRGPSAAGFTRVRVLHESASSGALDLYITAPFADLTGIAPNVGNLNYRGVTSYFTLATGTYQVRLTTAGTKTVVLDTGSLVLGTGDVRTILLLDAASGGLPAQTRLIRDAGT